MTRILTLLTLCCFILISCTTQPPKQNRIKIAGTVEFPDDRFSIQLFYRDGSEKMVIDSIPLSADNSFEKEIILPHAGVYTIDCMKWEVLNFWGEDEDIFVKFRGQDTAKVKIKNPPFQRIENSGPNNELMNLINYFGYMSYQNMIAMGQELYQASRSDSQEWKDFAADGYQKNSDTHKQYINFLAQTFWDRNSIIALLPQLRDAKIKSELLEKLDQTKADYPPYMRWKEQEAEKVLRNSQLQVGATAPAFSYPSADGKTTFEPADFKGKYLVIDFWASWCGPCRNVIPEIKELYSKYNQKGLEILSVSIDSKEKDWKAALKEEAMPWPGQILAPNAGKEVLNLYQFNAIPHIVLLDKDGKIIGRNLTMSQLESELEKLLAK